MASIFKLFEITGDEKYRVSAEKNIDWVVTIIEKRDGLTEWDLNWKIRIHLLIQ